MTSSSMGPSKAWMVRRSVRTRRISSGSSDSLVKRMASYSRVSTIPRPIVRSVPEVIRVTKSKRRSLGTTYSLVRNLMRSLAT